ncbi:MAG: ATP-binding cassette domain-containing protein [Desulfocucumaceae bacterium]
MAIIEIEDIYFTYKDGTEALRGLSLYIEKGERVALLGPNGAGKSTLLLHLNGINLPAKGRISVLGREISRKTEKWVRSKVGMVFQDPDDQVFSSTVWEDVAFGPKNMGLGPEEIHRRVENALHAVGMSEYGSRAPYHLSYGQKKRVAIAGVLSMQPEIIVLDEPMAFLDPRGKDTLQEILDWMHGRGQTIIIATHDVDFAVEWADRVVILKDGITLAQGGRELIGDRRLVEGAQLRLPVVSRIFRRVPELGLSQLPLTIAGAADIIKGLVKGCDYSQEKGREIAMANTLSDVSGTYPIWLEPEHLHYHPGVAQARVLWGLMMRREPGADMREWVSYAVDPSGSVLDADLAEGGEDYSKVAFFAGDDGLYNLVVESKSSAEGQNCVRRARLSVPVGHQVYGRPESVFREGLDIFCEEYRDYSPGQTVAIRVMFDGKPLSGAVVKATYHFYGANDYPWQGETGEDGTVALTFDQKGHWMFVCQYTDKAIHTSTFVLAGVR